MILTELLLSTSILSLAIFLYAFFSWKSDGAPTSDPVPSPGSLVKEAARPPSSMSGSERCDESLLGSNETPLSSTPGTPRTSTSGLSRRQRKNRKREKVIADNLGKSTKLSKSPVRNQILPVEELKKNPGMASVKSKKRSMPCKQYVKLNLEDHDVYYYLSTYISTFDQLRQLGFPMDSSLYPGKAYIYRDPEFCSIFPDGFSGEDGEDDEGEFGDAAGEAALWRLDVNAREFVPGACARQVVSVEGGSENNSSTGGSDSEMTGDSDRSQPGRKRSIDDISGIPLNATAKEFVPSNVTCSAKSSPGVATTPQSKLIASTVSSPNLYDGSRGAPPPPLISAASSITLREAPSLTSEHEPMSEDITTSETLPSETVVPNTALSDNTIVVSEHNGNNGENHNDAVMEGAAGDTTEDLEPSESPLLSSKKINNNEVVDKPEERKCVRCKRGFWTVNQKYLTNDRCSYHWGKLRSKNKNEPEFTCCGGKASRAGKGCSIAACHVWTGLPTGGGMTGPLEGYVKTKHRKSFPQNRNYGVYGLDCEMVYTETGLELGKVTVVGIDGRLVYESLVQPDNHIIDYNTRFSGITARDLEKGQKKNLKEVQNDMMGFVNADTILIGHGLENDLRALKLIHSVVIDTTAVFPHFYGLPFRRSLRSLVSSYLKRDIQGSSWGHDSYEDARACMELMLWKTRKDLSSRKLTEKLTEKAVLQMKSPT